MKTEERDRFADVIAIACGGILLFGVFAFGATPVWASSIFRAAIFACGIAWAIRCALKKCTPRTSRVMIPFAGVLLWGFLQLALNTSVYRFVTWMETLNWSAYFVLFFLSMQVFASKKRLNALLGGVLATGLVVSVFGVVQHFTSATGSVYWVIQTASINSFGPFVDGDHYAAFIEIVLPITIWEALRRRSTLFAGMAGFLFASVIACFSRTGSFLCLLELLIVPVAAGLRNPALSFNRALGFKAVLLIAFAVLFTFVVGWDVLWTRFQENDPYKYRGEIVISAGKMFRDRPWFGFGLGTFETAYPAYASFDWGRIVDHAHNDWVEWAATGGAPFAALMLSIFAWGCALASRFVWGIGAIVVLVHSLIDFPMQIPAVAGLVFVMFGALAASPASGTAIPDGVAMGRSSSRSIQARMPVPLR